MNRIFSIIVLGLIFSASLPAYAQDNVSPACQESLFKWMSGEEQEYRSVIFGHKKAEEAEIGSVYIDDRFNNWIKTGESEWRSYAEGFDGTTWSDSLMDDRSYIRPRRGLLEMRKTPTSDIIPPLLQSMRAFSCRLRSLCQVASASRSADEGENITVKPYGCAQIEAVAVPNCRQESIAQTEASTCLEMVDSILDREGKMLQLIVAYDAAYRTLMQFAGIFDDFLVDFRFPLLEPLWQMVRTLGALDGIPCFQSECAE